MDRGSKKSHRPPSFILESMQISSDVSKSTGRWTQEDDVRLIRAYECFNSASWTDVGKLFPKRNKDVVKNRYSDHLKRKTGQRAISVAPELMYGCIPPRKHVSEIQSFARSEETMTPDLLISGQPSGNPARPEVFVIFRESGYNKDTPVRTERFQTRAEDLTKVYFKHIGVEELKLSDVLWALIKNKSSNTNFAESNISQVRQVRSWLWKLQEQGFLGRVILIFNQVDGFSTNVNSLKTVFDLCQKLDLWMFFVHESDRRSLLHFQTLQGLISKIEEGIRPKELLQLYPSAHDYLLTLMFMTGVGVNKRNLSKNLQAQKQLGIGNRNHFPLESVENGDADNAFDHNFTCPRPDCDARFKTFPAMKKHVQKEHVENKEIDEFAVALGLRLGLPVTPSVIGQLLAKPSQIQMEPPPSDMDSEVSISHVLPGISNLVNPVLFNTRLAQPTTFIDPANGKRVNSRPSDDQIANLVIGLAPSAPGKHFTLEDDVRIIRLKEIEALRWADIAEHFPGREWKTLQKRYATKLTKVVKDHRPDEVTVKML